METLLPSEIARLVLGYLEETQCLEVAKMFLETSSYLQECRAVALSGKKFSTKVHGLTLLYIIEKFWAINAIIQDRLSKLEEYEQLKNCRDVTEQLKLLIDGSRGQRFFVSINVPSQTSQSSLESPVQASTLRKRRHSGSHDRDKCKRALNTNLSPNDKSNEVITSACDTAKQVPVDQTIKSAEHSRNTPKELDVMVQDESSVQCSSTVGEVKASQSNNSTDDSRKLQSEEPKMFSTATDTMELRQFASAEVQTALEDLESESDSTNMPIENLSMLTKELLNRTELHERIAETINKGLPTESLIKDTSITEVAPGELNTSIMIELNNAIKSIVTATESDPIFEDFLHEIIGSNMDDQIGPDEGNRQSSIASNRKIKDTQNIIDNFPPAGDCLSEGMKDDPILSKSSNLLIDATEVTCNSAIRNLEMPLDDYNAAAIQSIIDVKNSSLEEQLELNQIIEINKLEKISEVSNISSQVITANNPILPEKLSGVQNNPVSQPAVNPAKPKVTKKSYRKKKAQPSSIPAPPIKIHNENEITVPMLIVSTKEEMLRYLEPKATVPSKCKPSSLYVPIVPKPTNVCNFVNDTLYLRTVQVPQRRASATITTNIQPDNINVIPNVGTGQSEAIITLYGSENCSTVVKSADMPTVTVDEPLSISGTGLSPFIKFNKPPRDLSLDIPDIQTKIDNTDICSDIPDKSEIIEIQDDNYSDVTLSTTKNNNCDCLLFTKRTPKSILKSRLKNHRLSLSTPRRRTTHIRALDFNTPTESTCNNSRYNAESQSKANSSKSLCRSSLFKSPPFEQSSIKTSDKIDEPISLPIATRSPAPVLKGGWDKISGVGSIITNSPTRLESNPSPKKQLASEETIKKPNLKQSWDADLRKVLGVTEEVLDKNNGKKNTIQNNKTDDTQKNKNSKKSTCTEVDKVMKNSENKQIESINNSGTMLNSNNDEHNESILHPKREMPKLCTPIAEPVLTTKGTTKKYAKLKTITRKVSNENEKHSLQSNTDSILKCNHHPEMYQNHLSNTLDLETPRKTDLSFGIPPTPRVLSPNSNITTFVQAANEDSAKVQSFIATPEFPPTPNINLTPQGTLINSCDASKKGFSAPYFQPSSELDICVNRNNENNKLPVSLTKQSTYKKVEITQFEVIKENLPRESGFKELKISSTMGESLAAETNKIIATDIDDSKVINDLSDLDSSSSSSSCSCSSSSSCLSCSKSNTVSKSSFHLDSKETPKKLQTLDTNDVDVDLKTTHCPINSTTECVNMNVKTNDNVNIENNYADIALKNSLSPLHTLTVKKVDEILKDENIETPEKNNFLLEDLNISVTPICSKSGVETVKNLTSKITEFISTHSQTVYGDDQCKEVDLSLHNNDGDIDKKLGVSLNPTQVDQMRQELNEKRMRIIGKLNSKSNTAASSMKQVSVRQKPYETKRNDKLNIKPEIYRELPQANNDINDKIIEKNISSSASTRSAANATRLTRTRQNSKTHDEKDNKNNQNEITNTKRVKKKGCASPLAVAPVINNININNNPIVMSPIVENNCEEKISLEEPLVLISSEFEKQLDGQKRKLEERNKKLKDHKSKVDMVKRDLFSDEENNDSTNVKSDKIGKIQKSIKTAPEVNSTAIQLPKTFLDSPKEKLVVLESLKLVPANKYNVTEMESDADLSVQNHLEISMVHDDKIVKKRRRKANTPNLDFKVQTGSEDDSWVQITATSFQEIFSFIPTKARARKITVDAKPATNVIKSLKMNSVKEGKLKNSKSIVTSINLQPIATSSPISDDPTPKVTTKKIHTNSQINNAIGEKDPRLNQRNKMKDTETNDDKSEKKTSNLDPQILLKQVDINQFLTKVHGPERKT